MRLYETHEGHSVARPECPGPLSLRSAAGPRHRGYAHHGALRRPRTSLVLSPHPRRAVRAEQGEGHMIGIIMGVLLLAGVAWLVAGLRQDHGQENESKALREWRARRAKAAAELRKS